MCDEEEEEKEGRLSRQSFRLRKPWAADEERRCSAETFCWPEMAEAGEYH